jgi:hypothetical protein
VLRNDCVTRCSWVYVWVYVRFSQQRSEVSSALIWCGVSVGYWCSYGLLDPKYADTAVLYNSSIYRGHAVTQLVEALRYKPEGCGFDSRHNSFGTMTLGSTQPLIEMSSSNISWGKGGWCVGLTTLSHSCTDCLEIWEPQPAGTLRACPGLYRVCFTFFNYLPVDTVLFA